MVADFAERAGRLDLVAAALCDAQWSHPGVWVYATEARRTIYRRAALDLLVKLDARAAARRVHLVADLDAVLDAEDGLSAIVLTTPRPAQGTRKGRGEQP